jgi:cytochrome d ubiquinol oxidase subunit I
VQSDGVQVAQVADWWEMFLNHSTLTHITHVLLGAWLTGAFMLISVSAYYFLKKRYSEFSIKGMKVGVIMALSCCLLQLFSGDNLARNVATNNPEKFAALEGVYETRPFTPLYVWGFVDSKDQKVYGLPIPGGLSFLTYRQFSTPVKGLDNFPKDQWPWVPAVFQFYHLMILFWGLMLLAALYGAYMWWKKKWENSSPKMLKFLIIAVAFPQVANIAGWYTSCMGRQPWTVYKLMKTDAAYSPTIVPSQVWASFIMFIFIYLLFFALFLILYDQKIKKGPLTEDEENVPYRDIYGQEDKNG